MLAWLCIWVQVQICIRPSWCHCHSLSLAPVNPEWFHLAGFTFLVPAHLGSPGQNQRGHKTVVCVVCVSVLYQCLFTVLKYEKHSNNFTKDNLTFCCLYHHHHDHHHHHDLFAQNEINNNTHTHKQLMNSLTEILGHKMRRNLKCFKYGDFMLTEK